MTILDKLSPIFKSVSDSIEDAPFLEMIVETYSTPLLLFFVNTIIVPWIIHFTTDYERPEQKSNRESTIITKCYFYLIFNSIFLPLFNLTTILTLISPNEEEREKTSSILADRIIKSTEFFLRYLL